MFRRLLLVATLAATSVGLAAGPVAADREKVTLDWFACSPAAPVEEPSPCAAMASDPAAGKVELVGAGSLVVRMDDDGDIDAEAATGGGSFVHRDANGKADAFGAWTATKLLSFEPFSALTAEAQGGIARMRVHFFDRSGEEAEGELQITCLIDAPANAPPEGIKVNVFGIANFDQTVPGGQTLFTPSSSQPE
jgi:hypothetical protein